jgi:mannose-1-phosphate guanylyltransferase
MDAVVMAGGRGVRFRPFTENRPKPMIPFMNKPVMEYMIGKLKKAGIKNVTVLLGHLPKSVKAHFGDGKMFGVNIRYIHGNVPYGTAGSVKRAAENFDDPFLVTSADIITEIDLQEFIKFQKDKDGKVNIALSEVENPYQYGIAIIDEKSRISRFLEKPKKKEIFSNLVNTGIYIIDPEIMDLVPPKKRFDFSKDLFPRLLRKSEIIYGFRTSDYWTDVGTPIRYLSATQDALDGKINLRKIGGKRERSEDDRLLTGNYCVIDDDVQITGFAVIGNNVNIRKGTKLFNSIIWSNTYIGKDVSIDESIVGSNVRILSNNIINKGAMIPDNQWVL